MLGEESKTVDTILLRAVSRLFVMMVSNEVWDWGVGVVVGGAGSPSTQQNPNKKNDLFILLFS